MRVEFSSGVVTVTVELDDSTFFDLARDVAKDEGIDLVNFREYSLDY